jgi:hypothetical protein
MVLTFYTLTPYFISKTLMNPSIQRLLEREMKEKKAHITVRLVPEASKIANENLKAEIQREVKKAIYSIPWANELESIEIE